MGSIHQRPHRVITLQVPNGSPAKKRPLFSVMRDARRRNSATMRGRNYRTQPTCTTSRPARRHTSRPAPCHSCQPPPCCIPILSGLSFPFSDAPISGYYGLPLFLKRGHLPGIDRIKIPQNLQRNLCELAITFRESGTTRTLKT